MRRLTHRSAAALALLALMVPGLLGSIHGIAHGHDVPEAQAGTTRSVASAECGREASDHIEAAQIVHAERCATCVLQSKTRVLLDRRTAMLAATPTVDALAIVSVESRGNALVRPTSSRAPPQA